MTTTYEVLNKRSHYVESSHATREEADARASALTALGVPCFVAAMRR